MDSYPKINTIYDILKNYKVIVKNKIVNLDEGQIKKLLKLQYEGKDIFSINDKKNLNDLLGLIPEIGFDETVEYLKKLPKGLSKENIIFNSHPFYTVKRSNYQELVSEMQEDKSSDGIYKCPRCGSWNTDTKFIQTRSADEPETEISNCKSCGKGWRN